MKSEELAGIIKKFSHERDDHLRNRWLSFSSWWKRISGNQKFEEIERLSRSDIDFNRRWKAFISELVSEKKITEVELKQLVCDIKAHQIKHKQRAKFLAILLALIIFLLPEIFGGIAIMAVLGVGVVAMISGESIVYDAFGNAFEELINIFERVIEERKI